MLDALLTRGSHLPSREMQGWGKETGKDTGQIQGSGIAHLRWRCPLTVTGQRKMSAPHFHTQLVCLVGRRTEGATG